MLGIGTEHVRCSHVLNLLDKMSINSRARSMQPHWWHNVTHLPGCYGADESCIDAGRSYDGLGVVTKASRKPQ